MTPAQIIASLNAIQLGNLEGILARLDEAEEACRSLDRDAEAVVDRVRAARAAIREADTKAFRKHVQAAVSKLGHLR